MAYIMKTKKEFQEELNRYLEEHPLVSKFEEDLINNFSSSNLSDLYKLFSDLKDIELNENLYEKLSCILQETFDINPEIIFSSSKKTISRANIHVLDTIIKDRFSNYVSNPEEIDEDEFYRLSVIVNKIFPAFFLDFIENSDSKLEKQKTHIEKQLLKTIDHYSTHTSDKAKTENAHIASLIYMTFRELFPELNIYEVGRVKSFKSTLDNVNKESSKSLLNVLPSNSSNGISDDDFEKQFSLEGANNDFSGLTIVLVSTDDTLHFDKNNPASEEILKLRKARSNNITFIHGVKNYLEENYKNYIPDNELLQIKIEILARLRESTYSGCTQEYNGTSFSNLLKEALAEYDKSNTSNHDQPSTNNTLYSLKLNEINRLLKELGRRVNDKYQAQMLANALPQVLKNEDLVKRLGIKSMHLKTVQKSNGFCSSYYLLTTKDNRKIELQAQSYFRFKESKDGSADHSKLPNKAIDISRFFEKADPNFDDKKYEYLLNLLNSTTLSDREILYKTPEDKLSYMDLQLKKELKLAEEMIKLRDLIPFENFSEEDNTITVDYLPLEDSLLMFAEYVSPSMFSVSSPHTRFNKKVARYVEQPIVSCLSEVLLKTDSITCLSQELLEKLDNLEKNISPSRKHGKIREISYTDIINSSSANNSENPSIDDNEEWEL